MVSSRTRIRICLLSVLVVMLVIAALRWKAIVDAVRVVGEMVTAREMPRRRPPAEFQRYFDLVSPDIDAANRAVSVIEADWDHSDGILLLEVGRVSQTWGAWPRIYRLLTRATAQSHGMDVESWWQWAWSKNPEMPTGYAAFKAAVYSQLDDRFYEYFDEDPPATIRLEEIRWGGVLQDGIPPLKDPVRIPAERAEYLDDDNVIFGVALNDEAVAYPKRILGWHEMVKDTVGGESINGVYCTLCGSMIVYQTTVDDMHYELGTSGFLYRSNKLMYDHATKSLWSTLLGEPVVGPLVGRGIRLQPLHVVTTTWGEWRRRHPNTFVLSLETGYPRDYREGAAYRDYFSSDKLIFSISLRDERLKNKDEVLAIRFLDFPDDQLAISADYLNENRVYQTQVGSIELVVLTDTSGANRVYETAGRQFTDWASEDSVNDDNGKIWRVTAAALLADDGTESLSRLAAHRAFWFGWYAAYPQTRLVK